MAPLPMAPIPTGFPTYRTNQIAIRSENEAILANSHLQVNDDFQDLEVDYDNNVTKLYNHISNSQWQEALQAVRLNPDEARTWVVRYHEDEDKGMMWRFLPIHSAAARQPPLAVMEALIRAYPEGAQCCDDQGKYAIHYASGNQASADVIRALLDSFPSAATTSDPEGKIPLHWMALSGPFEPSAIEPLVIASKQLSNIVDDEGWAPIDYAREGDFQYKQMLIDALLAHENMNGRGNGNMSSPRGQNGGGFQKKNYPSSIPSELSYGTSITYKSPTNGILSNVPKYHPSSSNSNLVHINTGAGVSLNTSLHTHSNFNSAQSTRSTSTSMTKGSTIKAVAKFNAQIVKLKADQAYSQAEQEEKVVSLREEHDDAMSDLEASYHKTVKKNEQTKHEIASKEQFVSYKESRIASCEKEMSHYEEQNNKLQEEIFAVRQEFMQEKTIIDDYKFRIDKLQSKMSEMANTQEKIYNSLESIEADAKKASEARRLKLQELFDDELKDSREAGELKKVYGRMLGGPTIREALVQQKNLMKNCEAVLEDCDARDDVDLDGM